MSILLDTHFLLWVVLGAARLERYPWLERYRPWGVSPISFLEIQFLHEVGRLRVQSPEFGRAVRKDPRFVVDEAPLLALVESALPLDWTRDPFDRLLCGHSRARRVPLCSVDGGVRANHSPLLAELA